MAYQALGYNKKSKFTEALQTVVNTLSRIGIREKHVIHRTNGDLKLREDAPTNSMGQSSSATGPVQTIDPVLKRKPLKRLKSFLKKS